MRKTVKVLQEYIDEGRHAGDTCPIARAVKAAFPNVTNVWAGAYYLRIGNHSQYYPLKLSEWVFKYDFLHVVLPFEFEIDLETNEIILAE